MTAQTKENGAPTTAEPSVPLTTEEVFDVFRRIAGEQIARLLLDVALREAALEKHLRSSDATSPDSGS